MNGVAFILDTSYKVIASMVFQIVFDLFFGLTIVCAMAIPGLKPNQRTPHLTPCAP
jgi:hypothetical protein